jgi:hypothetical protein
MEVDILINRFNNAKGGEPVALLNTDPGGKGLFLLADQQRKHDRLTLNTIDPNSGKIVELATVPLGSGIVENAWYQLNLRVDARGAFDSLSVGACSATRTPRTPSAAWPARSAASRSSRAVSTPWGGSKRGSWGWRPGPIWRASIRA